MVNTLSPQRNYREFASYLLVFSLVIMVGVVFLILFQFSFLRPQFVFVGHSSEFANPSTPVKLSAETLNENIWVWVVQTGDAIQVFNARTPQYGCFINWQPVTSGLKAPGYFIDPCTGSSFFIDGAYRLGPSPRGLDSFPVKVQDGKVWIDVFSPQEGEPRK